MEYAINLKLMLEVWVLVI